MNNNRTAQTPAQPYFGKGGPHEHGNLPRPRRAAGKHIKDHIGDEIRKVKEREERETHGFHDVIGDEIAHEEKAERRQQDETDAALTETADTILRGE